MEQKSWGRGLLSTMGKDSSARRQKKRSPVLWTGLGMEGLDGGFRCLQGPGFRRRKSQKQLKPKRDCFHTDILLGCATG